MNHLSFANFDKTQKKNKLYALIFLFFVFGLPINYFANYFIQNVINPFASISIVTYGLLTILGIWLLLLAFSKRALYLFVYLMILFLTFLSSIIYTNASVLFRDFLNPAYSKPYILYFYCLPVLFFVIEKWKFIRDYVYKYFFVFSFVCLSVGLIDWVLYLIRHFSLEYMTFSYNMLMSVVGCFCFPKYSKRKLINVISLTLGAIGLACILISGSRGAMICALISIVLIFFVNDMKPLTKGIIFFALLTVLLLAIFRFEQIVTWFLKFAEGFGVRTRTLDFLSSGSLFESVGRERRIFDSFEGILKNPLGYGFYGDWHLNSGSYAHNIIIEMLVDFGIFLGPIIICWVFYSFISLLKTNDKYIAIIFASYGLFQLFFSGSFMWHIWFFILIGLSIARRKIKMQKFGVSDMSKAKVLGGVVR